MHLEEKSCLVLSERVGFGEVMQCFTEALGKKGVDKSEITKIN